VTETSGDQAAALNSNIVKVMIVDDSAVIRGFLTRFLEEDPGIKVISSVADGKMAVESLDRHDIDVVVLDIEMPVMDGLTALPLILQKKPGIKVVMASTLTKKNASETMKAFQLGAAECLPKPSSTQDLTAEGGFKTDLVRKVKELGRAGRQTGPVAVPASGNVRSALIAPAGEIELRRTGYTGRPDAIAIGSSTGGPQALLEVFSHLKEGIKQPIFITQHMPPTFTTILAEHISKHSGLACHEAKDGQEVLDGEVYLAPGDHHMLIKERNGKKVIELNQEAPENFCRPAVDPMLRSLIEIYGKRLMAVILTGMGADGLKGCQKLVEVEGSLIAQDEETSVVWGMPGAVAGAGICSAVLPLKEIGPTIKEWATKVNR